MKILYLIVLLLNSNIKNYDKHYTCYDDYRCLSLRVTVFDPLAKGTPEFMAIQSDGDGLFADLTPVIPEKYDRYAACPRQLFGATITIPQLNLVVYCGDNFGSFNGISIQTIDWKNGIMLIDVFHDISNGYPNWNYWVIDEWDYKWR